MPCCLLALVGLIGPRIGVIFLWLFTDRMTIAFQSGWVAIIGWVFLPWTTLAWAICYTPFFGVQGFGWFIVGLGFVLDIMSYASSRTINRS